MSELARLSSKFEPAGMNFAVIVILPVDPDEASTI